LESETDSDDAETSTAALAVTPLSCTNAKLGSKQGNISFADLEQSHANDRAFTRFRIKLNIFLNNFFRDKGIPLPDGKRIHLQADEMVCQ